MKRQLRRLGLHVGRYRNTLAGARSALLRGVGGIEVVIDVGAHAGEYGKALREDGYAGRILSFEPVRLHFERLLVTASGDSAWQCRQAGIGSENRAGVINVSGNDGFSSSMLPMHETHENAVASSRYQRTEAIDVITLDAALADNGLTGQPAFLKVDAQGYEHEVLAGASSTLSVCRGVELELSLTPLYEGQLLIGDILNQMQECGFAPTHIDSEFTHPQTGELLQVNCLFQPRAGLRET